MSAKTKLQTNIGRAGFLTGLEYAAPSKTYPDQPQIKVSGRWEGPNGLVDEHFWLSYFVSKVFTAAGLVQFTGMSPANVPLFQVVNPAQRIWIIRTENGNKKETNVSAVDAQGKPVTLPAQAEPPHEKTFLNGGAGAPASAAPAGAPGPGLSAPPAGGAPPAAGAPAASQAAPAAGRPAAAPLSAEEKAAQQKRERVATLRHFAALSDLAVLTERMALRAVLDSLGMTLDAYMGLEDPKKLHIIALCTERSNSLKIEAGKQGIRTYPGIVRDVWAIPATAAEPLRSYRETLTGMQAPPLPAPSATAAPAPKPAAEPSPEMDEEEDDDLPF